jgi:hypothetical protein
MNGANKFIQGSFVTFRFDWRSDIVMRPWIGSADPGDPRLRVAIITMQNVGEMAAPSSQVSKGINQAKQQITVELINDSCQRKKLLGDKAVCQLSYLLHTAIVQEGVSDWNSANWFKRATLFLDPGQGGHAVFYGPIYGKSKPTYANDYSTLNIDLWKSWGEPTQHAKFSNQKFQVEISFQQLENALKLIVARKEPGVGYRDVTPTLLRNYFGDWWDRPDEWKLLRTIVAQEVHNIHLDKQVYIGGGVKRIDIRALP